MKKLYTILCFILLTATSVVSANNLRFKHHAKAAEELTLKAPGYVVANEADTFKVTSLIKEDFSGFKEGSIDNPAETPVSKEPGWIPTEYMTSTGLWGGEKVYSAGGCVLIGYSENLTGVITTPDLDMSANDGPVVVTLKARKQKSGEPRDWICCDMYSVNPNDPNDFKYFQRYYGNNYEEWNEYKFTYTFERDKNRKYFFQIYGYDCGAFVDDIEVKFLDPYVEAPVAKAHTDFTNTGFTANWQPVDGADCYQIDLFTVAKDRYKTRTYIHRDIKVNSTSYTFNDINTKGKAYYYVVKAVKGGKVSPASNLIKVEALIKPTALSATYNEEGIELSWSPVEGAQYYRLTVNREHTAKSDETFIICRENFDRIATQGSYLDPHYLDMQVEFDGTDGLADWISQYGMTAEGAFGLDGTVKSQGYADTYLQSHYMDLAAAEGAITVKADLYNVDDNKGAHYAPIIRLLNLKDNTLTTVDSKSYRDVFDEWKTVEATLKGASGTCVVEFAAAGGWVYIDNIELSCRLKAGAKMSAPVLNTKAKGASASIPMTDLLKGEKISFGVTAIKEVWDDYGYSIDYIVSSEPSDRYMFSVDIAGVESIIADPSTAPADVYNLQGLKILDAENADQINTLPTGIYITGGKKIYVK